MPSGLVFWFCQLVLALVRFVITADYRSQFFNDAGLIDPGTQNDLILLGKLP